jgi:RNA polymerase sigma-70 factor, ECF subfamily
MREAVEQSDHALLTRAASGDSASWHRLLEEHHPRLYRMAAIRLDPRLQGRLDPSDVLQDVYVEAFTQLSDYLRRPELPFFLWLRSLTGSRLARLHRHHLGTQQRDASREVATPEVSSAVLADQWLAARERPSGQALQRELREQLQAVLECLTQEDREVLSLRHFEQLSTAETAAVLGIREAAAGKRYVRALTRLRRLLELHPDLLEGWRP